MQSKYLQKISVKKKSGEFTGQKLLQNIIEGYPEDPIRGALWHEQITKVWRPRGGGVRPVTFPWVMAPWVAEAQQPQSGNVPYVQNWVGMSKISKQNLNSQKK
jgi:hypothetical protein